MLSSMPQQPEMQVWSVGANGSAPRLLGAGDAPAISPDGSRVAFASDGAVMIAPIDASAPAKRLFFDPGQDSDLRWSPDGSALEFDATTGAYPEAALSGVTTTVTYTGVEATEPTTVKGTTGTAGCVVFGGLPATSAEVEVTELPGYVIESGAPKVPTKEVTIAPNITTHDSVVLNEGGAITASWSNDTFGVLAGFAGVSNDSTTNGFETIGYTNPAIAAPTIGATQKSQSCSTAHPPTNNAGPVLRAGFTDRFVTGIPIR